MLLREPPAWLIAALRLCCALHGGFRQEVRLSQGTHTIGSQINEAGDRLRAVLELTDVSHQNLALWVAAAVMLRVTEETMIVPQS